MSSSSSSIKHKATYNYLYLIIFGLINFREIDCQFFEQSNLAIEICGIENTIEHFPNWAHLSFILFIQYIGVCAVCNRKVLGFSNYPSWAIKRTIVSGIVY